MFLSSQQETKTYTKNFKIQENIKNLAKSVHGSLFNSTGPNIIQFFRFFSTFALYIHNIYIYMGRPEKRKNLK